MADDPSVNPLDAITTGAGPDTVLLLHGQPGSHADWQWVVPRLEDDYRVVVPDRPGYGRTAGPATGFAGNAAAAVDLLDRMGLERVVLVAHSWAGGVALAAAIGYPTRIGGLVLVSSVAPGEPMHWDDRVLAAPVVGEALAGLAIGGIGLLIGNSRIRSLADRRLAGRARDGFAVLDLLTRDHAPVWRSFVTEQRAMLAELDGLASGLAGLAMPTAIVHGARDRLVPVAVARALQAAIPGATLDVLPDVGHMLPHDRPDAIATAVRRVSRN